MPKLHLPASPPPAIANPLLAHLYSLYVGLESMRQPCLGSCAAQAKQPSVIQQAPTTRLT